MPKISFLPTPHISSVLGVNSPSIFPAFTLYTSGVPDKGCDFVGCSYTLHHKNRILVRFFLHIRKFCCRSYSPFFFFLPFRFHFSLSPEKSPQNAIFLAHLANFLYLCNRFLRWREICPTKSVSQWSSWVGF